MGRGFAVKTPDNTYTLPNTCTYLSYLGLQFSIIIYYYFIVVVTLVTHVFLFYPYPYPYNYFLKL